MKYLKLDDIEPYNLAFELSNVIWDIVIQWDSFAKFSIGQQFVNSVDSISANIAEGFGRYHKKDKIRFYQIARGSLLESQDWARKANTRELLVKNEFDKISSILETLPKQINILIKLTNDKLSF